MEYLAPKTLKEVISLLNTYGNRAKIIAGGTDLIPLLKRKALPSPEYLIDLNSIQDPELKFIEYNEKNGLRIGALTTLHEIEKSQIVKEKFPSLHEACRLIGHLPVRNIATVGGNICRASPASDLIPPLLTFDSKLKIVSSEGERNVNLENFFKGPGQTILKPNEIVIEINSPPTKPDVKMVFIKKSRTFSDLAKVNMALLAAVKNNALEYVKIALGSVAHVPLRARKTEEFLKGKILNRNVIEKAMDLIASEIHPITDLRSTAEYRRHLCKILLKRFLFKLMEGRL
jgi:carbon-monoxide dehydrogenase medium subunit